MKPDPRQHIYERDNYTCKYCGRSGADDFESWNHAWFAIDHVKPKKHDGSDCDSNLVVACHTCNSIKGAEMCESVEEGKKSSKGKIKSEENGSKNLFLRMKCKSHNKAINSPLRGLDATPTATRQLWRRYVAFRRPQSTHMRRSPSLILFE